VARRVRLVARELEERGVARIAGADVADEDAVELVSSGHALSHTAIRIIGEDDATLSEGVVGEIAIRGDAVAGCHELEPEASTRAFRGGELHMRDLGFRMGDDIFVIGRKDDLIIVAGRKICPHDVEEMVADVDGVQPGRVVALAVPDEAEGTHRLVVLAEASAPAVDGDREASLRAAIAAALVPRRITPHDIRVVPRGTLLKSSSGKLSRARNRTLYLERLRLRPVGEA
jgi:acyl-CoA synthetase (AMP-forming)/AMP-acid ligase II